MDVTRYLNIFKKDLQGRDKLTAEIAGNDETFRVNFRLFIKLKVHTCSLGFTQDNHFILEHGNF